MAVTGGGGGGAGRPAVAGHTRGSDDRGGAVGQAADDDAAATFWWLWYAVVEHSLGQVTSLCSLQVTDTASLASFSLCDFAWWWRPQEIIPRSYSSI